MLGATTAVLLTLLTQVLGNPVQQRSAYAVKETHTAPRKWTRAGRAPANAVLKLAIGVKQGNFEELERHLYEGEKRMHYEM